MGLNTSTGGVVSCEGAVTAERMAQANRSKGRRRAEGEIRRPKSEARSPKVLPNACRAGATKGRETWTKESLRWLSLRIAIVLIRFTPISLASFLFWNHPARFGL